MWLSSVGMSPSAAGGGGSESDILFKTRRIGSGAPEATMF